MDPSLFGVVSVLAPLAMVLGMYLLRGAVSAWRTCGADILGILIVVDFAVACDLKQFSPLIREGYFRNNAQFILNSSVFFGTIFFLLVSILIGERNLSEWETLQKANRPAEFPWLSFGAMWAFNLLFVAGNIFLFTRLG